MRKNMFNMEFTSKQQKYGTKYAEKSLKKHE